MIVIGAYTEIHKAKARSATTKLCGKLTSIGGENMDADSSRCIQKNNEYFSNDDFVVGMLNCKDFFAMQCSCALFRLM